MNQPYDKFDGERTKQRNYKEGNDKMADTRTEGLIECDYCNRQAVDRVYYHAGSLELPDLEEGEAAESVRYVGCEDLRFDVHFVCHQCAYMFFVTLGGSILTYGHVIAFVDNHKGLEEYVALWSGYLAEEGSVTFLLERCRAKDEDGRFEISFRGKQWYAKHLEAGRQLRITLEVKY